MSGDREEQEVSRKSLKYRPCASKFFRHFVLLPIQINNENDSLTCIHLSAGSEGRELVDKYLALQRAEMPDFSLVMMFGRLLCFMGEYAKAREHFEHLLATSGEDKASLHHNLAFVSEREQNFHGALEQYKLARALLEGSDPPRRREMATTLNNMASIFSRVSDQKLLG